MAPAITVEGLSKRYVIGHQRQERYVALRDVLADKVKRGLAKLRPGADKKYGDDTLEEFWALKDVGFTIDQGDRVGVIGRNGAGKSTLLKVLSRITEPTSGKIRINGRVASLLEVGTGFHPELTGRENIFLNGAILGMSKAEIKKKFDEIVAFAEIEKFLDTPVKRYSSGMYVRLAFSVAAHLESEILIVDEVLAVGDASFQKKCLGKMEEVGQDGRTVLFVSHNMAMISNLCQKGVVIKEGGVLFEGKMSEAVLAYCKDNYGEHGSENYGRLESQYASNFAALIAVELIGARESFEFTIHDEFIIRMKYRIKQNVEARFVPEFHFYRSDGTCAFVTYAENVEGLLPGEYTAECTIPARFLNDGIYFVGAAMAGYFSNHWNTEFHDPNALTFNIIDPMDQRFNRYGYAGPIPGVVRPKIEWSIVQSRDSR
jgi:lipopolysaccharide transport system ATP-binding protein